MDVDVWGDGEGMGRGLERVTYVELKRELP